MCDLYHWSWTMINIWTAFKTDATCVRHFQDPLNETLMLNHKFVQIMNTKKTLKNAASRTLEIIFHVRTTGSSSFNNSSWWFSIWFSFASLTSTKSDFEVGLILFVCLGFEKHLAHPCKATFIRTTVVNFCNDGEIRSSSDRW